MFEQVLLIYVLGPLLYCVCFSVRGCPRILMAVLGPTLARPRVYHVPTWTIRVTSRNETYKMFCVFACIRRFATIARICTELHDDLSYKLSISGGERELR